MLQRSSLAIMLPNSTFNGKQLRGILRRAQEYATAKVGITVAKDSRMCNQNEWIVREAFLAYARGDVTRMMDFVHQDLEWTYLDPAFTDPPPQTCHGRGQLEKALLRRVERGLRSEVEQVVASGEKVMLVTRTPGADSYRMRQAGDLSFDVLTVKDGLIVALHACHDRAEAQTLAGID